MGAAGWLGWKVVDANPSEQAGCPATDNEANLGVLQADLAGLAQGGLVVPGQPGQASDRKLVVTLLDGEGYRPLNQPLDPGWDGRLLGRSSGHMRTLAHPPDGPAPQVAGRQGWASS